VIAWGVNGVFLLHVYVVIYTVSAGCGVDMIEGEDEGRVWEAGRRAFVGLPKIVSLPTV